MAYTIGIDFGTNSVRSIVVRCSDGSEVGTSVFNYPSGEMGILLDPKDHNLARQHPGDYLLGLEASVKEALAQAKNEDGAFSSEEVIGIGVDTTGSSPIPVDEMNVALATKPEWKGNLSAECWLWKDHTSIEEAGKITETAAEHRPQFIAKCGNTYSSEWFWAKLWHCFNVAPDVFEAAYSWVEFCDWIPSVLSGISDPKAVKRGVCAAGHKALYAEDWNGLPDKEFLAMLDPRLADLRDRLYEKAHDANEVAGNLSETWGSTLGLRSGIPISIGAFDVHFGAIGSGVDEGTLVKVIGTSTCDCGVVSASKKVEDIPGICGIVNGSILPGFYGLEAGQSAVGDIFAWFVNTICKGDSNTHQQFTEEASQLSPGESGLLALDWNNGNRTVLVDPLLSGLLLGQSLHTSQAEVYRALIEATAFGARAILERMDEYGVETRRIVCAGGIAQKNPMMMQIYADVTGREMLIAGSDQACALGSAVVAAVAAGSESGGYDDFVSAQKAMTRLDERVYYPDSEAQVIYDELYRLYKKVHDAFGGVAVEDLAEIMKRLLEIKKEVSQ
jgi:L-ribulokinase